MKIGLLAYHSACNFGATLQLLSTYHYLKNNGITPIIINWIAPDLQTFYEQTTPKEQITQQEILRTQIWSETELCKNSEDIAQAIERHQIQAIIIGSDAVAQHHPWVEKIIFPTKTFFSIRHFTTDRIFPNPFWGTFNHYLKKPVPIAVMSASSQDSRYLFTSFADRQEMAKAIEKYQYISVRDEWTQKMIAYITNSKTIPQVTPDPVFAFNQNVGSLIPTKQQLQETYNLPDKYLVLSFISEQVVHKEWLQQFEQTANQKGYACFLLPFSQKQSCGNLQHKIELPLSPLHWYGIIKHSQGYIGNNMHPIVVCLHNSVPFFSFDNYGLKMFNGLYSYENTSKIKHILHLAGQEQYRVSCLKRTFTPPSPDFVLNKIINFNGEQSTLFAETYLNKYNQMMKEIINTLSLTI
ncbi:MAG: polysaccharide pyruvyl transferase family protein [Paludibacteraceae bacterium]|nr:polysaccharide pyruvyl transferase family protein [Paludibacteraceae bacterium]